jgi:hypothetical protein
VAMTRGIVVLGLLTLVDSHASAQGMPPEEIHDRIVAIMQRVVHREVAVGDTFVTWSPNPVLYTTVQWTNGPAAGVTRLASSMSRADSLVGTADATWINGIQTSVAVKWTKPDSIVLDLRASVDGGMIHVESQVDTVMKMPMSAWAIADYGMEDQLLPVLSVLPEDTPTDVEVFRPFAGKWDTLQFRQNTRDGARIVAVQTPDGEVFYWVVTEDNALVRITRSLHADVERRPLETSPRYSDYKRYRAFGNVPNS